MELAEDQLRRLVQERLIALKTNAFAVEREAGLPQDAVRSILRGDKKTGTALNRAAAVLEALGLELQIGPTKRCPSEEQGQLERDFVSVRRYDVAFSAGHGSAVAEPDQLPPVAFRTQWLSVRGLRADSCCVVNVVGDSMAPTLHDGDIALVDCRSSEIRNRRVYAFVDVSGDLRVKRLERHDAQLFLRSDNTDFDIELRTPGDAEQMKIIGPVRWSGHTW